VRVVEAATVTDPVVGNSILEIKKVGMFSVFMNPAKWTL
jgi:hypothetical protein